MRESLAIRFSAGGETAVQRRYEILAQELRGLILSGELKVGDPLPAERDLVEITGLGRGSVREAIRILEIEGLLSPKKPGRKGVSVVQNASDQTVQRQLELFIGGDSVSNDHLLQARMVIEPALARIACDMRTDDDIEAMRAINARIEAIGNADRGALVQLNLDWHSQMFAASHNDLLVAIAIGLTETQHRAGVMGQYGSQEHVRLMVEAHGKILESIIARDGERAYRRTYLHLRGYADTLAKKNPREFDLTPLNPR
ncbi:FadR/GntR family transcriptional regulator [Pseudooceanicola pacificus]|uniref:FadR/GntR family transcriptional regulator n=1 Tax=Pseudooceanicola pacificus TaxID=2676438 RepID=UPI00136587E6|nr:FCD domain-containing protein [Pseudooceanicola pacificus]